jgi:hypothetical protein
LIIVWVIIRCGIISFPRYFARKRCYHIQGDWIRFWWMLKWLEEAKWGRYTIAPLFPLRSCDITFPAFFFMYLPSGFEYSARCPRQNVSVSMNLISNSPWGWRQHVSSKRRNRHNYTV